MFETKIYAIISYNILGQKQAVDTKKRKTTGGRGKKDTKTADRDDSDDEPVPEPKKRRTGGGRGKKDTKAADDKDLSDGVEWYDEDTCEAATCKRPKNKRTPWVSIRLHKHTHAINRDF